MGALARFLLILDKLVKSGVINKIDQAIKFAKNEFGEVTPLIKKQIEKVFKETKKPQVGTPAKKEATVSPIREGIETLADKKVLDKLDDVNLSKDDPLGDLEKIVKGEGDTGLPKVKSDDIATKTEIQGDEIFDVDPVSTDKSIPLMERVQKKVDQAKKQASGLGKPLDEFAAMSQTDKIKDAIKKLREARRMEMGSGREGDVRTALRQFVKKELQEGRLDIPDAYEKKMIAEDRQGGVDPIDVFRKAYGEDALIAVDDIFDQYGDALRGPTYSDIEQNFRKLFRMNRGFYDEAALPIPKKEYGFDPGLVDNDQFAEKLQQQLRQLEELDDFTPPTDRKPNAEGGLMRTNYAVGTGLKLAVLLARKGKNLKEEIRKMIDNIFPSGDSKYDADVVLDNVLEDLNIDRDAVDGYDISKAYGEAYDMLTAKRGLASKKVPGGMKPDDVDISQGMIDLDELNFTKNAKAAKEAIDNKSSTQVFKDSEGGIKGITMGGDKEFKDAMSEAMEEGIRESENMKRLGLDPSKMKDALKYDEMKEAGQLEKNVTGSADLSPVEELKREFPGITDEMIENILSDNNPQRIAEVKQTMREAMAMEQKGMSADEIISTFKNIKRTKNAKGGRIGLDSGGTAIQKLRQDLVDNMAKYAPGIPESKLQEIVKDITFDMSSEEVQKTVRTGLINLFGMATGGRVQAASGGLARILNL